MDNKKKSDFGLKRMMIRRKVLIFEKV